MDKHAWDPHGWDSSLLPDRDKKKSSLFDALWRTDAPSGETNNSLGSGRNQLDFGFSGSSALRRDADRAAASDDMMSRSDTAPLFGREEERKREHFGERLGDEYGGALGSVPWMKGPEERDPAALEQMPRGGTVQSRGEFGSFGSLSEVPGAVGSVETLNAASDPLHSSSLPPSSLPGSSPLTGSPPEGGAAQLFGTQGMTSAWESDGAAPAPLFNSSSAEQPWSAGNQRSEPPAQLPFPHRPGSPFQ